MKENFIQAMGVGSEVVEGFQLDKVVTLVDTSTFCTDYMEYKRILERPDLVEDDAASHQDCHGHGHGAKVADDDV